MSVVQLLREAYELDAILTAPEPDRLNVSAPQPLPDDLIQKLTDNKPEIIEYIRNHTDLIDLPWPIGYGGLPVTEVTKADIYNDRQGITDPVQRRLNVLSWMRCHYRDIGDEDMAHQRARGP